MRIAEPDERNTRYDALGVSIVNGVAVAVDNIVYIEYELNENLIKRSTVAAPRVWVGCVFLRNAIYIHTSVHTYHMPYIQMCV